MKKRNILILFFIFFINFTRSQLTCNRVPTSFCCTSRIRVQCPQECANVQCGVDFINSLFSIDSQIKSSIQDGNSNISENKLKASENEAEIITKDFVQKESDLSTTTISSFPTLIPIGLHWSSVQPLSLNNKNTRRRTTPDPRIIRPPESLVVIGEFDEEDSSIIDSNVSASSASEKGINEGVSRLEKNQENSNNNENFHFRTDVNTNEKSDWKVSLIPQGQSRNPNRSVKSIPPFFIDGESDKRFKKFYRTFDKVIERLDLLPTGNPHTRSEVEPAAETKSQSENHLIVPSIKISSRTTISPGSNNNRNSIDHGGSTSPLPQPPSTLPHQHFLEKTEKCGISPNFEPCVSNDVASRELLQCCKRKNLPLGCQNLCRYNVTQPEIRSAMDKGQCGIFSVAPFLECASQGNDNTECCLTRGIIQKTGPQCEQFCRPTKGLTSLGIQHIVCGNFVSDMLYCHHSGIRIA